MITPAGPIYHGNKTLAGGVFDVEHQTGTLNPIENVIFTDAAPGYYFVIVFNNFDTPHDGETPFTVSIVGQGDRKLYEFNMPSEIGAIVEVLLVLTEDGFSII